MVSKGWAGSCSPQGLGRGGALQLPSGSAATYKGIHIRVYLFFMTSLSVYIFISLYVCVYILQLWETMLTAWGGVGGVFTYMSLCVNVYLRVCVYI